MQDNVTQAEAIVARHIDAWGWGPLDQIEGLAEHKLAVDACAAGLASTTAQSEAVQKLVDLQREWFCDGRDCTAYDHGRDEGLQMALDAVRALYPEGQP